jgi:hypothetical protein
MTRDELAGVPQAYRVDWFYCENPKCRRPHVVLFDANDKPFAQFVISEMWGADWISGIQDALYRGAVEREGP